MSASDAEAAAWLRVVEDNGFRLQANRHTGSDHPGEGLCITLPPLDGDGHQSDLRKEIVEDALCDWLDATASSEDENHQAMMRLIVGRDGWRYTS